MKSEQLDDISLSSTNNSASDIGNKEGVTISFEEYEKLISDSKRIPEIIQDFEKRLAEGERDKKQAEKKAELNAFRDSKILSQLQNAAKQYDIDPPFEKVNSIKDAKLAFLDAMKNKYDVKFQVDESGDLDAQIENMSLLVQQLTAYKQMVNARSKHVAQTIDNTIARRYMNGGSFVKNVGGYTYA
ncbi:hypothetical protein [Borrelia crocidurae]|uniref:Uncharacterized protein n=1 Tax=Borrelia crocidurae (strain Achema) TaxID=1155096 RepID=I0FEJ6_BORCA|nr:hypothetical protein [Borrelia crocidurae]AFI31902.1 hypothetical protein Q7M_1446 [Borrelia crocidurae str. Achema]